MSFVLTNGMYYIKITGANKIEKTSNIEEARKFKTLDAAIERKKICSKKCKGYDILDVGANQVYTKRRRKIYPYEVRKMIYDNAEGHCTLCGRKILYEDMTIDHVIPLAMGGADEVENLTCACQACNELKGSILPENFMERITMIFIYQMEKKYQSKLRWKIIHRLLVKIS